MKLLLSLFLLVSISLSDEITLKTGFLIHDAMIIEINYQHVIYSDRDTIEHKIVLRDINSIRHVTERSSETNGVVFLRNGNIVKGKIKDLDYQHVTMIDIYGDTVSYDPSSVLRITGEKFAFSFHGKDDTYFFLTRNNIRFVGGTPSKSLEESRYRFIASLLYSAPTSAFRYSYPDLLNGSARPGYGFSFTIDQKVTHENAFSFSYRFSENSISWPESLGGSFSEWTNHFLSAGLKRYFPIGEMLRLYAEGKVGYVFTKSPENSLISSDQAGSLYWSAGCGIYLSENISFDLFYLSASSDIAITRSFFTYQKSERLTNNQKISVVLVGFSYTFGSYN
jgi:hypothetical protein